MVGLTPGIGVLIFWQKEITTTAVPKMLVKLTTRRRHHHRQEAKIIRQIFLLTNKAGLGSDVCNEIYVTFDIEPILSTYFYL